MGLLTDPRAGTGKVIKLMLKWEKPLCFALYAGGVLWLMLLALPAFNDSTVSHEMETNYENRAYDIAIVIARF